MAGQNSEKIVNSTINTSKMRRIYSKGPQGLFEPRRIASPMNLQYKSIIMNNSQKKTVDNL